MSISINNNLMGLNTANTLQTHYGRLSTSVERLSSGLRINSAADDAAGLAIRELMRADVAALNQGMRNANDAISMIQVADGALAIIDERLIRMKELAEQAATGTYSSIQRLMIDSEYKAMADEIDRIARATDYNGIKLLDGSLSGKHNGKGLNSTGSMKIHFGTANDSAEDYYYVQIGDCTTKGLGLGASVAAGGSWVKKEGLHQTQQTFKPVTSYIEYKDPDTGKKYYSDGDYFFSSHYDPASTMLDWDTDREIIERLKATQRTTTSSRKYKIYLDPATNVTYYRHETNSYDDSGYITDPMDDASRPLDPNDPAQQAIIDRLVFQNSEYNRSITWKIWKSKEDGSYYYSRDEGLTFVKDTRKPYDIALDSKNPAHKADIAKLDPDMVTDRHYTPVVSTYFPEWQDPQTGKKVYSLDGGKTFFRDCMDPQGSALDPAAEKELIARLEISIDYRLVDVQYDRYYMMVGGQKVYYYSRDHGRTFLSYDSIFKDPFVVDLDSSKAADQAIIAQLQKDPFTQVTTENFYEYEDPNDNYKKYYSADGGQTFCTDRFNPSASMVDKNAPGYSAFRDSLINNNTKHQIVLTYTCYENAAGQQYWSQDNGATFVKDVKNPFDIAYSIANPSDLQAIQGLSIRGAQFTPRCHFDVYRDPVTDKLYYTPTEGPKHYFRDNTNLVNKYDVPIDVALSMDDPEEAKIINRLQPVQYEYRLNTSKSWPDVYYIYEDTRTGKTYYAYDDGKTITSNASNPYAEDDILDPVADRDILDNLRPRLVNAVSEYYVWEEGAGQTTGALTISTQQAAQGALVAIDRAIVSKDQVRAHLGAMQNRLENTVTNLNIQAESMQNAESRISDADVAYEMTNFVRNQILTQSAVAMLGQANSYPHILMSLLG